jgi:hypothetical protein
MFLDPPSAAAAKSRGAAETSMCYSQRLPEDVPVSLWRHGIAHCTVRLPPHPCQPPWHRPAPAGQPCGSFPTICWIWLELSGRNLSSWICWTGTLYPNPIPASWAPIHLEWDKNSSKMSTVVISFSSVDVISEAFWNIRFGWVQII